MLDVNRLRVIDAVARHGSVTAAAKELHYSQPSVTHSPRPARGRDRRAAAAAGGPRGPAPPGRTAAGRPRRRAGWPPCATRPGSPAASAAAATCCPCAPTAGFDPRIGYVSDDMVVMQ